ncbi:MAG TPA: zinc ribbon domain-containing protein, partial [Caldimonas sp.]
MAKICSTCQADNRDEAQFCRACGTPFAAAAPVHDAGPSAGITCADCGFVNKPGLRYCAKCGVNLMGTVVVPRSKQQVPAAPPVPAYSAPTHAQSDYPPPFDPVTVPDVPDP